MKRHGVQCLEFLFKSLACPILLILSDVPAEARSYSTGFALNENPISEGGRWINGRTDGIQWADVATTNGHAIGLESGFTGYDDATALLTGAWGSNQSASATVFTSNRMSGNVYEEVEIRLRSSLSASNCTGYEVNFSLRPDASAYVQIVRWNGPLGSFDYVNATGGSQCILHPGDVITGTITNNAITAYINGTNIVQGIDTNFVSGSPGIGIFIQGASGVNGDYGFTHFSATDGLPDSPSLAIAQPGANVLLSWLTNFSNFHLTMNSNPAAGSWISVTNKVTVVGNQNQVILTATNNARFFRLQSP